MSTNNYEGLAIEMLEPYLNGERKFGYDPVHRACEYRTKEGHKCAIGYHIPDDQYATYFEGQSVEEIIDELDILLLNDVPTPVLTDIQYIHDSLANGNSGYESVIEGRGWFELEGLIKTYHNNKKQ